MNNDPSLLEFGRFGFSNQLVLTYHGARPMIELEYDYHNEDSPPVDYSDSELLDKESVRRLVTYLNKWLEENEA